MGTAIRFQQTGFMPQPPKPFSSDWLNASPEAPREHTRGTGAVRKGIVRALAGFPGDRPLAVMLVTLLVVGSFLLEGPALPMQATESGSLVGNVPDKPDIGFLDPEPTEKADISTDQLQVTDENGRAPTTPEAPIIPDSNLQAEAPEEQPTTAGGILPSNRILAFYGFPGDANMGILGEYDMQRLLEMLNQQASEYEAADPSHPVVIAFEVIGSVAQPNPQADGSYLLEAPSSVLDDYAQFTKDNGLLMIIDAQIGRRGVADDVKALQQWLRLDHVHLALDPEFSFTKDGEAPGQNIIGGVDASDVQWAQQYLVDLAATEGLPPKVLIVHQFTEKMISNKDQIVPMRGVQLVIDADGFGQPDLKESTYDVVNGQSRIEYAGIKLFYTRDVPLMTPDQVVNLDPPPLFVMYQ